jgi:hypothetical protein
MADTPRQSRTVDGGTQKGGVPVDYQALLKRQAEAMKAKIGAPSGDKIRLTKKKTFRLPNGQESAGPLRVVVLDFVSYNAYYDRPFSEKEMTPPACFALGSDPKELAPSDNSPDKQSDEGCGPCPLNEFGSRGAGKACGNHRLLAVVEASDDPKAPIMLIQTSPTSIKHWDSYVAGVLASHPLGITSVTTEIWFDPDAESQVLRFGNPEENENIEIHAGRCEAALKRLMTEPDVSKYQPVKRVAKRK